MVRAVKSYSVVFQRWPFVRGMDKPARSRKPRAAAAAAAAKTTIAPRTRAKAAKAATVQAGAAAIASTSNPPVRSRKRARAADDLTQAGPSTSQSQAVATTPTKPPTNRAKKAATPSSAEKRLARFTPSPTKPILERIQRAFAHRLYLIERHRTPATLPSELSEDFAVLGATGNVYTVTISNLPSCSCPDAAKGNVCKHRLFVMLRVLKLRRNDPRVWQKALLNSELEGIIGLESREVSAEAAANVIAAREVREKYAALSGQKVTEEDHAAAERRVQRAVEGDCPICYEPMVPQASSAKQETDFCRSCGNNMHKECLAMWAKTQRSMARTCPLCRAPWHGSGSGGTSGGQVDNGYINLAQFSSDHQEGVDLEQLYPESHQWIEFHSRRRSTGV
eukprot:jgi/Chlat1/5245/Chrsp33S05011